MTIEPTEWTDDSPRPVDRVNRALAIASLLLLAGAAWFRFGPGAPPKPLRVGQRMPPTRLIGLHDAGSRLLLGMEGRILWLVFLPDDPAAAAPVLPELAAAWGRLKDDPRFGMAVAAAEDRGPDLARAALEDYRGKLPLYLAGRDAPRSFGVGPTGDPWHFLVDPHGRVAAVARGSGKETVDRLEKMADDWLDALAPAPDSRFRLVWIEREPRPFMFPSLGSP